MKRRTFLKAITLAAAFPYGGQNPYAEVGNPQPNLRGRRPNIVLILADDLGYGDLGCYGQRLVKTPNIDRLAAEGMRFTQAYAGSPVCAPSRCALMTGLHTGHAAVRDNVPHYPDYLGEKDLTLAELLKKSGYLCGGVGKWSLGDAGTNGRATNKGFDMWFGYLNQDHAHYYYPAYLDDNESRLELPGNMTSHEHYSHDLCAERALDFIKTNKNNHFFLYAAFTVPHFSAESEDPDGFAVPENGPYENMPWDEKSKKYAAMLNRLDDTVGKITACIESLGLTNNTLILFASDNGGFDGAPERFKTNGPLRGFKRDLTEGGIRVPLIARWPGAIPAAQTSSEIVAFWDMLPTCADLAGAPPPADIDGISILDALIGRPLTNPHEYLYWDYGHCRDRYDQAVRMNSWKGIRRGRGANLQLFDLDSDPAEEKDIAPEHPDIVRKIENSMNNAFNPNPRYPIGVVYTGNPLWTPPNGK